MESDGGLRIRMMRPAHAGLECLDASRAEDLYRALDAGIKWGIVGGRHSLYSIKGA